MRVLAAEAGEQMQGPLIAALYMLGDLYREKNDGRERLEGVARRIWQDGLRYDPEGRRTGIALRAVLEIIERQTGAPVAFDLTRGRVCASGDDPAPPAAGASVIRPPHVNPGQSAGG